MRDHVIRRDAILFLELRDPITENLQLLFRRMVDVEVPGEGDRDGTLIDPFRPWLATIFPHAAPGIDRGLIIGSIVPLGCIAADKIMISDEGALCGLGVSASLMHSFDACDLEGHIRAGNVRVMNDNIIRDGRGGLRRSGLRNY